MSETIRTPFCPECETHLASTEDYVTCRTCITVGCCKCSVRWKGGRCLWCTGDMLMAFIFCGLCDAVAGKNDLEDWTPGDFVVCLKCRAEKAT